MVHDYLKNYDFVLGSRSPRRLSLLKQIGLDPEILYTEIEENDDIKDPDLHVSYNAEIKLNAIRAQIKKTSVALTADTIVVLDDLILGKPDSIETAADQLRNLSGKYHLVKTGLSFYRADTGNQMKEIVTTKVKFKVLNDDEIESYLKTGEPIDKAGSYGIQGYASQFVDSIEGCYFNVVGLPISTFYEMVKGAFYGN